MATGLSVHIGLNSVDPARYEGWDGTLVACENDAHDMARLARTAGFETTTLLTPDGTVANVTAVLGEAAGRSAPADGRGPDAVLVSACQDDQVAADGDVNGAFTAAVLRTWDDGAYRTFHKAVQQALPRTQRPSLYTTGSPDETFLGQRPFTI
ncbi:hypothetical protein [Streptomyces sp. NPDC093089]|uniref:hypothetical protein n=1 Tax=Streptomyces sp. NPDC093089 TaxID=3366024 RepID=UPI00382F7D77